MRIAVFAFIFIISDPLNISSVYAQQSKVDSLKLLLAHKTDTSRISLLLAISEAYLNFSAKKALEPAAEARLLASQAENPVAEAKTVFVMGKAHAVIGNYYDAEMCFVKAGEIFSKENMVAYNGEVLVALSNLYVDMGKFPLALDKALESYILFEKNNDKRGMSRALINSGNVYRKTENYTKAIIDFLKALDISRESNDKKTEASALNNISIVYGEKGDHEKEIEYLNQAKAILINTDDKVFLAKILNNIGTAYLQMEEYKKAIDYIIQALDIRKQIGDKRGMVSSYANLGNVNYMLNKYDKAIEYFDKALELAEEVDLPELKIKIFNSLAEAFMAKGDYKTAISYIKQKFALKDSLFNKDFTESIAEMQARFGVEKAESEARAQKAQKKFITILSVIGIVLLLIIIGVFWKQAVTRKKINYKLNQQKQKIEYKNIALQNAYKEIEVKNKDITDSILYARRIQEAILPEVEFAETFGRKGFVFYKPKDIVSGDFYWMQKKNGMVYFAAVDCTGHGVPGAFMSIVCSNLLTQAVVEHGCVYPDEILNDVDKRLSETLRQRQDDEKVRDGMDIALCCIDAEKNILYYSGAFNPAWIYRKNTCIILHADKFPVGHFIDEGEKNFTLKETELQQGDRIYIFSDGFMDQFGGEKCKKYKRGRFADFLASCQKFSINQHQAALDQEFMAWKGINEQVDDVLVIGVEV